MPPKSLPPEETSPAKNLQKGLEGRMGRAPVCFALRKVSSPSAAHVASRKFQHPLTQAGRNRSFEEMGISPVLLHLFSARRSPVLHVPQLCWWQGHGELRNKSCEHSTGRQHSYPQV